MGAESGALSGSAAKGKVDVNVVVNISDDDQTTIGGSQLQSEVGTGAQVSAESTQGQQQGQDQGQGQSQETGTGSFPPGQGNGPPGQGD